MSYFVGARMFSNDAVAATKVPVKEAPAKLHALRLLNTTGSTAYLQIFNKVSADVTVGTTTADAFIRIPANAVLDMCFACPIDLDQGLTLAGTTSATNSSGAAISIFAVYE